MEIYAPVMLRLKHLYHHENCVFSGLCLA